MELEPRVREWIGAATGDRVVGARPLTGGYSNDNTLVAVAGGGEFVLRRYLRTNACAVEAALAARLSGVVPVAEVVAADPDGTATGEPALLSVFVPGRLLGEVLAGAPAAEAAALGRSAGRTLAAIGTVTFAAPGFFSDGTLDAFVRRCLAEGNAAGHLTGDEQARLVAFAERAAADLEAVHGARQLVHADYNPKNLLAGDDGRLTAVLDWEFAFSGSPLTDVGNMLRDPRPAGFADAFIDGFADGGGALPANWRALSRAVDLYSLADFLTRPPEHRYFQRAVHRIRDLLASRSER
jgi:aminoglycoside phosphotransferase (APT) family kinase protein